MTKLSKISVTKVFVTLLNVGMLTLAFIYLRDMPRLVLLLAIVLFASLGVIVPSVNEKSHEAVYKFFVLTSVFAAAFLLIYVVLDASGVLSKCKDIDALVALIRSTKQWGVLVYIALVIFQVVFLPIPSAIVAVLGSILYGPTYAFIYMTAGTLTGSVITFLLGKIFGRKLVIWMIGEEKTDKYAKLLNEKGRFFFIIAMLFPFFPDDIICLVAGMTKMSLKYFTIAVSLTRPVMIAFFCYFGSGTIIPFKGWGIPVWIGIIAITIIAFFVINKIKKRIVDGKTEKLPKKSAENNPNS